VGETLATNYDLSAVDEEDRSSVVATMTCVATLEQSVPRLDMAVTREAGYYVITVRDFNEYIDLRNWHERVRVRAFGTKMRLVRNFLCNPGSGTLVVRVGMHQSTAGSVDVLPALLAAPVSRKRGAPTAEAVAPPIDLKLARRIMAALEQRCDMDKVQLEDRKRVLSVLYHVTMLDPSHPLLDIRQPQRDTGGYVVTCRGFPNLVDFDEWYTALLGNPHNDESLRSLRSVSYNPAQGVLQLCIEGPDGQSSQSKRARGRGPEGDDNGWDE
jgi:hypothetical protein